MSERPAFPALAFHRAAGGSPGWEELSCFRDAEDFSTGTTWELKHGKRLGMVLIDRDLRCWRVVSVVDLGVVRPFWERVFRFLMRQSLHGLDQQIEAIEPITLEQVKTRAAASLYDNPDNWQDDEAIAGEAGPWQDEQECLDKLVAKVNAAQSLPQIINAIYEEEFPG